MRVTEALIRQNNMNRMKKKQNQIDAEDDEPTQAYKEQKLEWWSINQQKSTFASPMDDGINSRESVFDRQAVFRTKEG
ncbi:MAG: hypothetical protein IJ969_02200 [Anaerotignum sp.]|nr:hypothetical protein [Anaerotignum sp.]MBR2950503.1 hypothetical protein [Lachnospiraceae bacterium]MBQ7085465.1 hypothetical protein [Anaerotignum sp.]MBR2062107.1 hypothetical protein [Anaerotignum sp.]MBR2382926.1 hypothetical protein [Anaerotignum sp.]